MLEKVSSGKGIADVACENGKILGMAAWDLPQAPGAGTETEKIIQRLNGALAGFPAAVIKKWETFHRVLFAAFDKIPQPYWDLGPIVVNPEAQGMGVGATLIHKQLAGIDAASQSCILGTQDERNLAFYSRFGFQIISCDPVSDDLFTWVMRRSAG
jgi:GNAT superfamily N-acetyltransferase